MITFLTYSAILALSPSDFHSLLKFAIVPCPLTYPLSLVATKDEAIQSSQ